MSVTMSVTMSVFILNCIKYYGICLKSSFESSVIL